MLLNEPEILAARQGYLDAQADLMGGVFSRDPGTTYTCGWFGTSVMSERGFFALVNEDGPLTDLIGDRLRVIVGGRSVYVYVLTSAVLPQDLCLARRPFAALAQLAVSELDVSIEVISG